MEKEIHEYFTAIDWAVVGGYLLLTTWVGHLMKGKQASIHDFFLGGRSLPWPAVSGSIIATEISGVTFIGVPAMVFAMNGNFTYLQWAIGSILARVLVGWFFVRVYYENEIYSPYDYMGMRLGNAAKTLTTILFTIGSILAQSVRVLIAAIPLELVTGMPFWLCIIIIGLFAIGWTLMGGMRTVIWTDVMQFILFLVGGVLCFIVIAMNLDGGWDTIVDTGNRFDRFRIIDGRLDPTLSMTLWVAIIAVPFQNLGIFGTDQLMAQRMFCCRNAKAASKAIVTSSFSQVITLLMLMVGAALFAHYQQNGFSDRELVKILEVKGDTDSEISDNLAEVLAEQPISKHPVTGEESGLPTPKKGDYIFPIWIVTNLPVGLRGLILAAVFAAAISSLDSILAALSQTTLSLFYHPERGGSHLDEATMLRRSRILVVGWGLFLTAFTFVIEASRGNFDIVPLAFAMTAYTVGPILAIFVCALGGRVSFRGLLIGTIVSMSLTMIVQTPVWNLFAAMGMSLEWLGHLPTYEYSVNETTGKGAIKALIAFPWMWPVTTVLTLAFGLFVPGRSKPLDG
ncbi:MAG: sodium/solute symporter [Gammaproteobacteria bacterium]|nr:sodium/solute symporter [Gammaproteobacteria bacterium]